MSWSELLPMALLTMGALFFLAGTVGLLRFPGTFNRLHALTKADNLGLGFVVAALIVQSDSVAASIKLLLVWLLALLASTTVCYLVAAQLPRVTTKKGAR